MRKLLQTVSALMPFVIIGALLYAGIFIKPDTGGTSLPVPVISARDAFYGIQAPSPDVLWAVGRGGKIVRSGDGGASWMAQPSGTTANLQSIAAWDDKRALVVGNAGTVLATEDGGLTWARLENVPQNIERQKYIRIRTAPGGVAWVVGEFGLVARTTDHGQHWSNLGRDEDVAWNDIAFRDELVILVGEFGKTRRSRDDGLHWEDIASPRDSSLMGIEIARDGMVVAVGLEGVILVSHDQGASWKEARSGTREHLFGVTHDQDRWFIVGDQGTFLISAPGPDAWRDALAVAGDYTWHMDATGSGGIIYLAGQTLSGFSGEGKLTSFR